MDYNKKLEQMTKFVEIANKKAQEAIELDDMRMHMRVAAHWTRRIISTVNRQKSFLHNEGLTS